MIPSFAKTIAVVACTTILSTLAVNAMDTHSLWARSMLGAVFLGVQENSLCPEGMNLVESGLQPFCIDVYEVAPGDGCPHERVTSAFVTERNALHGGCAPVSAPGRTPWVHVDRTTATMLCERVGKRLPTAREWYLAAMGTPDSMGDYTEESCNVSSNRADGVAETGSGMRCVSDVGVYDMVGNVWEWVADDVDKGTWDGRALPASGLVSGVDIAGVAYATGAEPDAMFAHDRITVDASIKTAVMRGGHYQGGVSAGVYALYASSPETFAGDAVGFRCVSDVEEYGL